MQEMFWAVLLAMLFGMFGQGMRVIAGLKKLADHAAEKKQDMSSDFSWTRFTLSLFIGSMAGLAAYLGYWVAGNKDPMVGTVLFGIVAAGYSGADFIEAFAKKHLPKSS